MVTDRQGNTVSGATAVAVQHFDQAAREFNVYRGDPLATADRAIAEAPRFVMAHLLKAHLYGLATEPAARASAGPFHGDVTTDRAAIPCFWTRPAMKATAARVARELSTTWWLAITSALTDQSTGSNW